MGRIRTRNLRAKRALRRQVEFEVKLTRYIEAVCAAAVERFYRRLVGRALGIPAELLRASESGLSRFATGGTFVPASVRHDLGTEVVIPRRRYLTDKPILLGKVATTLITDGTA